MVLTNILYR